MVDECKPVLSVTGVITPMAQKSFSSIVNEHGHPQSMYTVLTIMVLSINISLSTASWNTGVAALQLFV